ARLALATVDLELVLHPARAAVRLRVVAQGRALAGDPGLERPADAAVEPANVVRAELVRGPQRVDARAPERLVDVDVPHPGERALVEEGRLHRRATRGEALPEPGRREEDVERLVADLRREIRLELPGLEQQPGAEAADGAIE